jgi:lysylphosphatidylglycerol synthase-like protein
MLVLRFAAAATVLVLVARVVDWSAMGAVAATADWLLALPALILAPVQILLGALLWRRLTRPIDPELTVGESIRVMMGSQAVSMWTPASAGDFAARPVLMPRGSRRTLATALGVETIFRHPVPVGAAVGMALTIGFTGSTWLAAWAAIVAVLSALPCLYPGLFVRFAGYLRLGERVSFVLQLRPVDRARLLVGHGFRYVVLSTQLTLLVLAVGGRPDSALLTIFLASFVVMTAKLILPLLSFAELGIREGAAIVVFGAIGFSAETALQASLLLYAMNLLIPAVPGAILWLRKIPRALTSGA